MSGLVWSLTEAKMHCGTAPVTSWFCRRESKCVLPLPVEPWRRTEALPWPFTTWPKAFAQTSKARRLISGTSTLAKLQSVPDDRVPERVLDAIQLVHGAVL